MPLRVTQSSVHRAALASVRQATRNLTMTQEQIATARQLNRLSDAPLDAARAHRLRADRSRLEQHRRCLDQAQSEIEFTADVLNQVADVFIQARDICIQGADATTDATARATLASSVDRLIESLVDQANATFNGRYLFAGTATDTAPFAAVPGDTLPDAVAYQGNEEAVELQVGPRTRVTVGEPGSAIFDGTGGEPGAFEALIELRDLLRNTGGLSGHDQAMALSAQIDRVQAVHDRVMDATARFGWRSHRLEFARTMIDDATLADTENIGELEDADMAAAAARLYQQETMLQSALIISARMMQNTLLEHL